MILALLVGVAGGVGALARFVVDNVVTRRLRATFPYGTLLINVLGSLVLGLLVGLAWHHGLPGKTKLVIGTGFCGGLTTWSTASWETVQLANNRLYRQAVVFASGGLLLALAGGAVGIALGTL